MLLLLLGFPCIIDKPSYSVMFTTSLTLNDSLKDFEVTHAQPLGNPEEVLSTKPSVDNFSKKKKVVLVLAS